MSRYGLLIDETKPDLHVPEFCNKCHGRMKYQGVGEYMCEDCGELAYDDYGKVRNYLEQFPGSTAFEVEQGTGVRRDAIVRLLKEDKIGIKPYTRAE